MGKVLLLWQVGLIANIKLHFCYYGLLNDGQKTQHKISNVLEIWPNFLPYLDNFPELDNLMIFMRWRGVTGMQNTFPS